MWMNQLNCANTNKQQKTIKTWWSSQTNTKTQSHKWGTESLKITKCIQYSAHLKCNPCLGIYKPHLWQKKQINMLLTNNERKKKKKKFALQKTRNSQKQQHKWEGTHFQCTPQAQYNSAVRVSDVKKVTKIVCILSGSYCECYNLLYIASYTKNI